MPGLAFTIMSHRCRHENLEKKPCHTVNGSWGRKSRPLANPVSLKTRRDGLLRVLPIVFSQRGKEEPDIQCAPLPNLVMFLEDLMGQSNFVEVIKKDHTQSTSPLFHFLANGGEEPVYKMIRVAELNISIKLILYAVLSGQPDVLRKLLALTHKCPDKVTFKESELQSYFPVIMAAVKEQKGMGSKAEDEFNHVLEMFLQK